MGTQTPKPTSEPKPTAPGKPSSRQPPDANTGKEKDSERDPLEPIEEDARRDRLNGSSPADNR
jgi:hypothetical protein